MRKQFNYDWNHSFWFISDHVSATNLSAESNKLSAITEERDLLNANLSAVSNKLSSMTEERDLLQANLTETTKELKSLQSLSKQSPCICCWDLLILFLCVFVEKFSDKFTVWWWYNDVASQIQCYTKLLWLFFPSTCLYKTAIVGYIVCTGLKTTMVLKA